MDSRPGTPELHGPCRIVQKNSTMMEPGHHDDGSMLLVLKKWGARNVGTVEAQEIHESIPPNPRDPLLGEKSTSSRHHVLGI